MAAAGTALIPITCPVRIGVTPSGPPDRFRRWGRSIGAQHRGARPRHPGQSGLIPNRDSGTCLGVLRLFKDIDPERAELIAAPRGRGQRTDLQEHRLHHRQQASKRGSRDTEDAVIEHPNLRGPGYFH